MIRYIFLIIVFCSVAMQSFSQNYQSEYLEAKRLYNNKDYRVAKDAFKSLIASSPKHNFGEYASFFYGLSAYNLESYNEAKDMWLQVRSKYPNWDQSEETQWWLAAAYFKLGDYSKGNQNLVSLRNNKLKKDGEGLKVSYLIGLDSISELISLYSENNSDPLLANFLLDELVKTDLLYEFEQTAKDVII